MMCGFKTVVPILLFFLNMNNNKLWVHGLGLTAATSVSRVGGGSQCLLFFTGGSNIFQSYIYDDFIKVIESRDIDVYDVPFNYQLSQKDINELHSDSYSYQNIVVLGHSSGCTTLLNQCCDLDDIDHIFLLDPVNTRLFQHKWNINTNKAKSYKTLSFIHAMKSYKITFDPFGLPFIPVFKLTSENLNTDIIPILIDIENYGHSDILNKPLSDFMHNTRLSVGNKNRTMIIKQKYFDIILSFIQKIMDNEITHFEIES